MQITDRNKIENLTTRTATYARLHEYVWHVFVPTIIWKMKMKKKKKTAIQTNKTNFLFHGHY